VKKDREQLLDTIESLEEERAQLREENERFRDALARILDGFTHTGGSPQDVAREALYGGGDTS